MLTKIEQCDQLSSIDLGKIIESSRYENYRFIDRLVEDWQSGRNCFDKPGEALFVAILEQEIVGVCGLNIDPYIAGNALGRVRHLYVLPEKRRYGIGQSLVKTVIERAGNHFTQLNLRTLNPAADKFYRRLGFMASTTERTCTHKMVLDQ